MSKRFCKECGSVDIRTTKYSNGGRCFVCEDCYHVGLSDDFPEYTIFHKVTASPEVLAEKLVYRRMYILRDETWTSHVIDMEYSTRAEAIAATVARLKEVAG